MRRVLFTLLTICLLFTSPVFAQNDGIGQSSITPASPLYFLKAVREIIELKLAPTTHIRSLRELEFANRRIREVKSLVEGPRKDLISPTLEKYWSGLGQLIGIADLREENQAEAVSISISLHMSLLQEIFNNVSDPKAKRSLKTAIYRLSDWDNGLISKLNTAKHPNLAQKILNSKISGCQFLSREASSSGLNITERVVFSERAKNCLKDLENYNNLKAYQ